MDGMIPQTAIEAAAMIAAGFIFNIIETAYFGWNTKPSCTEEMATGFLIASGAAAVIYEILAYWNEKDKKNGGD